MATPEEILQYWFGAGSEPWQAESGKSMLWFRGGPAVDAEIARRFGEDLAAAGRGERDAWAATPRGLLALIIVLDQFSRNVFRGSAAAFAQDARAQQWAQHALERGDDRVVRPIERLFLILPFEHAENLAMQERSVALTQQLVDEAPPAQRDMAEGFLRYAIQHRDVIARFGRFPHRNRALGRPTTESEEAYLEAGGGF